MRDSCGIGQFEIRQLAGEIQRRDDVSLAQVRNSARISSVDFLAARYPNISATGIRVPLMQGLPRKIPGSLDIRSCHAIRRSVPV
jgi:hypothetical protein